MNLLVQHLVSLKIFLFLKFLILSVFFLFTFLKISMKSILSVSHFNDLLISSPIVIVMFSANWCGPCRLITPKFENLKKENVTCIKIDISNFENLSKKYNISSLPTFVVFKNGKEFERSTGSSFSVIQKYFD